MKKILIALLFSALNYSSVMAQELLNLLGKTEKEVLFIQLKDEKYVFEGRKIAVDKSPYLNFKYTKENPKYYLGVSCYFNESGECDLIKEMFPNEVMSNLIGIMSKNKEYKPIGDLKWVSETGLVIEINVPTDSPIFSIDYYKYKE